MRANLFALDIRPGVDFLQFAGWNVFFKKFKQCPFPKGTGGLVDEPSCKKVRMENLRSPIF
jgi:hypothetical protein